MRALVQATTSGRVGVIGTVGTIASGAYQRAVTATGADVDLDAAACPGFVEFVERGETSGDQVTSWPSGCSPRCATPSVDTLLLGCTHYPYLARVISDVMGRDVVLVSSADETAFEVRRLLDETGLRRRATDGAAGPAPLRTRPATWHGSTELGRRLLGPELAAARQLHFDDPSEAAIARPAPCGRPSAERPASTGHRPKELSHAPT